MNTNTSSRKPPLAFFLLVLALSVPFWVVAAMVRQRLPLPMNLPLSSLSVFCPLIAALILVRREDGPGGIRRLLRRVFDYRRIKRKIWYLPIIFGMPLIMVVSYGVMRLMGLPLPAQPRIPLLAAPVLFVVYFAAAAGEEAGWTGYAVEPMQDRWSALKTSLVLGSGWAIWHVTLYAQAHHDLAWIAWQTSSLVAVRLLIVWLYNNTGKAVLTAILFHDMMNVSQGLFPNSASHYDPAVTAPIIMIAAVIVTFLWGAKTLARYRFTTAALPGRFEEVSR
jgi:membrane protease YdiL (CAAX protease family)